MNVIQLDFFEDKSELGLIKKSIDQIEESNGKVRKRLFASLSELQKRFIEQEKELERLRNLWMQKHN